jgi:hypothetical protein
MTPEPAECSLDDPTVRQKLESAHVVAPLDDLHPKTAAGPQTFDPGNELSGVAAICPDEPQSHHGLFEERENEFGSIAILNVRRVNNDRDQQPKRIDEQVPLATIDLFARIVSVRPPLSVVLTDWLSMTAALGCRSRPTASRRSPWSRS